MKKVRLNTKAIHQAVLEKHDKINVGQVYFLSSFYDKEGVTVRVLDKSTKENLCGWKSSVTCEVLEVHMDRPNHYTIGKQITVNASNLYEQRELASVKNRFRS
jgi:hypothetical protein